MLTATTIVNDLERYLVGAITAEVGEKIALACAEALFQCLYLNFRGQNLYVPSPTMEAIAQRNAAIWADFDGRNQSELALKYKLSVQQIYSITKAMRKRILSKSQSDIFGAAPCEPSKPLTLTVFEQHLPADLARAGYPDECCAALAKQLAEYLCQRYAGLLVSISDELARNRPGANQASVFW